jgi:hypothetical protein
MFTKPPFTYFEITLIQIHFTKTTLDSSIITKIPLFICAFKFSKVSHKHTQALHLTNTYFTLTNYMPSLQTHEMSQCARAEGEKGQERAWRASYHSGVLRRQLRAEDWWRRCGVAVAQKLGRRRRLQSEGGAAVQGQGGKWERWMRLRRSARELLLRRAERSSACGSTEQPSGRLSRAVAASSKSVRGRPSRSS